MSDFPARLASVVAALRESLRDSAQVSYDFFKVMIPLIIVIKILTEFNLLRYFALPFEPLMGLAGLPPDLGIAWVTGIVVNNYSGVLVFLSLLPQLEPLSVAQVTTFSLMLLLAHSLIAEGRIAQQCGVSFMAETIIRLVTAVIFGVLFSWFTKKFGYFTETAVITLQAKMPPSTLWGWALNEARNLASIFGIIYFVMLLQRMLKYFKISDFLGYLLSPFLRLLGMSPAAATTVVVGFCMGVLYGSGIIIKDARSGLLQPREIFAAVTLMSLAHALIEDTILVMLLGSTLWGVLVLRLVAALLVGVTLNFVVLRRSHPAGA